MPQSQGGSPFLEQVRNAIRVRHYSIRTEEAYVGWIKRFILFHGKRHPREMGDADVASFLTHLAVNGRVAAATQNQALNALVFLYKVVLDRPLGEIQGAIRAKKPQRLPVVLTADEVRGVLQQLSGTHWLVACLLYALKRKYRNAPREWHWQYLFPSGKRSMDPRSSANRGWWGVFQKRTADPAWFRLKAA